MAVRDILRYNQIARAGQPVSLTGEAVVQLGALFSQMDFDLKEEEEEIVEGEDLAKARDAKTQQDKLAGMSTTDLSPTPTALAGSSAGVYNPLEAKEKQPYQPKTTVKPNTMPMGTEYVFGTTEGRYTGPLEEDEAYLTDNLKGQYKQGPGVDLDKYLSLIHIDAADE